MNMMHLISYSRRGSMNFTGMAGTTSRAQSDRTSKHNQHGTVKTQTGKSAFDPNGIPDELKSRCHWVCWRYETREDKITKVPYMPSGTHAKSNDPSTWSDFQPCVDASSEFDGIGIMFGDGLAGIDLDHHIDEHGNLSDFAKEIVAQVPTYWEVSPSGHGLHGLCFGALPGKGRKDKQHNVEMYGAGRYFTVTGRHYFGTATAIEHCENEVVQVYDRLFGAKPPALPEPTIAPETMLPPKPMITPKASTWNDQELIEYARHVNPKFERLWGGDISAHGNDASSADMALMMHLAYYTGKDATRMDRLYSQWGLKRAKWDEVHYADHSTYGATTIAKAIAMATSTFDPAGIGKRYSPEIGDLILNEEPAVPLPDFPIDWEDAQPVIHVESTASENPVKSSSIADCPPLPKVAQFDPTIGEGAGAWIDWYVDYASAISPMTPRLFHENAALTQVSIAIARRLMVPMSYAPIYPNLFSAWIAPTTLWNKTTALDIARRIIRRAMPHLLASQDTTPEALLSDMAGYEPTNLAKLNDHERDLWQAERDFAAQRGLMVDEMSGLLAQAGKDYNAGLIEAYLKFYDCEESYSRSTRVQGRMTVRNSYLSFIGASTPGAMVPHLKNERLWAMGWWARFALLTPETDRPEWKLSQEVEEPSELTGRLHALYEKLPLTVWPEQPTALAVPMGRHVFETWGNYSKAMRHDLLTPEVPERLWGWYGRAPTHVLKVATILAALDWAGSKPPTIELPHMVRAMTIVERWRESIHRLISTATQSDYNRAESRVRRCLVLAGSTGATLREVEKALRDKTPREIEEMLQQMINLGEVAANPQKPGPKGGRPTLRYRLV
jgi:hypothetical protein